MKSWLFTCPVCGKKFYAEADVWAFKRYIRRHRKLFCSWKCLRAWPDTRCYVKRK